MVTIPTIDQISGTTVMNKMRSLIHNYIEFGTEVGNSVNYMQEVIDNLPHDITDVYNKATIDAMIGAINDEFSNYYTKLSIDAMIANYYTKSEVNSLISTIGSFHAVIVDELPDYGDEGVIYLLEIAESGTNRYEEYIWVNRWELIGQLSNIDLADYYTKTESDAKFTQGVGNIGSDNKPVKIVNNVAIPVSDNLQTELTVTSASLIPISGVASGGGTIYKYGKVCWCVIDMTPTASGVLVSFGFPAGFAPTHGFYTIMGNYVSTNMVIAYFNGANLYWNAPNGNGQCCTFMYLTA